MPTELPQHPALASRRRALKLGLVLGAMLAAPVVAYLGLQSWLVAACVTAPVAEGELEGKVVWRITRMTCGEGATPFFDVAVGARDKTLSTALTARGAPAPVSVERLGEDRIGVRFDSPPQGVPHPTPVRLRKSGSPAERIDLESVGFRRVPRKGG